MNKRITKKVAKMLVTGKRKSGLPTLSKRISIEICNRVFNMPEYDGYDSVMVFPWGVRLWKYACGSYDFHLSP